MTGLNQNYQKIKPEQSVAECGGMEKSENLKSLYYPNVADEVPQIVVEISWQVQIFKLECLDFLAMRNRYKNSRERPVKC